VLYVLDVVLDPMKKRKTIKNEAYAAEIARRFTTLFSKQANNCLLRISQGSQLTYKHI